MEIWAYIWGLIIRGSVTGGFIIRRYFLLANTGICGRDVPDTTLPDTGFNRIVIYRIPDIPDTG